MSEIFGPSKVSPLKLCSSQIGPLKLCPSKISSLKMCLNKTGSLKLCLGKGSLELFTCKASSLELLVQLCREVNVNLSLGSDVGILNPSYAKAKLSKLSL